MKKQNETAGAIRVGLTVVRQALMRMQAICNTRPHNRLDARAVTAKKMDVLGKPMPFTCACDTGKKSEAGPSKGGQQQAHNVRSRKRSVFAQRLLPSPNTSNCSRKEKGSARARERNLYKLKISCM